MEPLVLRAGLLAMVGVGVTVVFVAACERHGAGAAAPRGGADALRDTRRAATCVLRGPSTPGYLKSLYATRDGAEAVEIVTGPDVTLELDDVGARARAVVRTPAHGPAFVLRGWLEAPSVFATRNLEVVPGHVWIAKGTELRVRGSEGNVLRVGPDDDTSFGGLVAAAPCDAVALVRPAGGAPTPPELRALQDRPWERAHVAAGKTWSLSSAPGGPAKATLRASGDARLVIAESKRGMSLVWADGPIFVLGWVPTNLIEAGTGDSDSGGCFVDPLDRCPDDDEEGAKGHDEDGCPSSVTVHARAAVDAVVFTRPHGTAIGALERGARVIARGKQQDFTRVAPLAFGRGASKDKSLWVESRFLVIE